MLLHGSSLHLLFNMYWIYVLGSAIEIRKGTWVLAGLVLATQLAATFGQILVGQPNFVGISGAVYGLLGYVWMKSRYRSRGRLVPRFHDDRSDGGLALSCLEYLQRTRGQYSPLCRLCGRHRLGLSLFATAALNRADSLPAVPSIRPIALAGLSCPTVVLCLPVPFFQLPAPGVLTAIGNMALAS